MNITNSVLIKLALAGLAYFAEIQAMIPIVLNLITGDQVSLGRISIASNLIINQMLRVVIVKMNEKISELEKEILA